MTQSQSLADTPIDARPLEVQLASAREVLGEYDKLVDDLRNKRRALQAENEALKTALRRASAILDAVFGSQTTGEPPP